MTNKFIKEFLSIHDSHEHIIISDYVVSSVSRRIIRRKNTIWFATRTTFYIIHIIIIIIRHQFVRETFIHNLCAEQKWNTMYANDLFYPMMIIKHECKKKIALTDMRKKRLVNKNWWWNILVFLFQFSFVFCLLTRCATSDINIYFITSKGGNYNTSYHKNIF
jgi:hypothetical protein